MSFSEDELFLLERAGYRFRRYLHQTETTLVGIFDPVNFDEGSYVVKRKKGCHRCIEYEYSVGQEIYRKSRELNREDLRLVGKTLDLLRFEVEGVTSSYLILEHLSGRTLTDLVGDITDPSIPVEERVLLVHRFMDMVKKIQEFESLTGFTHYDLHYENIVSDDNLETFKLLDFGVSHLEGVIGWAGTSNSNLVIGAISSVFDPWFDPVRLIMLFYLMLGVEPGEPLKKLLLANRFSPWIDLAGNGRLPRWISHHVQAYPGSELIDGIGIVSLVPNRLWSSRDGGFWVGNPSEVECGGTRSRSMLDASSLTEAKRWFGDLLLCLKLQSTKTRPNPNPEDLLDIWIQDVRIRILA